MDGNEVINQIEIDIEKAHVDFYTELYSLSEIDEDAKTSLRVGISRVLPAFDSDYCEGTIAMHEATRAVKDLRSDDVPGPDGLTVEFYKCFWDLLRPKLVEVANKCFDDQELTESMKSGVTRILFQKGNRKNLKN